MRNQRQRIEIVYQDTPPSSHPWRVLETMETADGPRTRVVDGAFKTRGEALQSADRAKNAGMQWAPIITAPHGVPLLVYKSNTNEIHVAAKIDGGNGPGWCTPDGCELFNVTHWQCLPTKPKKADHA